MKQKFKTIGTWVLQVLLGLEFVLAGQAKFTVSEQWIKQFERFGYPDHFYLVIGGLELILAVLLFIPKFAARAAIGLGLIMLGAAITHSLHGEWDRTLVTVVLAGLLGGLYLLRRKPTEERG